MALDDDRIREGHVQSIRSQLQLAAEKADAIVEQDARIQFSGTSVTPFDSSGGHLYREIGTMCVSRIAPLRLSLFLSLSLPFSPSTISSFRSIPKYARQMTIGLFTRRFPKVVMEFTLSR